MKETKKEELERAKIERVLGGLIDQAVNEFLNSVQNYVVIAGYNVDIVHPLLLKKLKTLVSSMERAYEKILAEREQANAPN